MTPGITARNRQNATHGLLFVLLLHPFLIFVFDAYGESEEGMLTQSKIRIGLCLLVMDVLFYMVRTSSPKYVPVGTVEKGLVGQAVCEECQSWVPPRSHHCHTCKRCVVGWQNHCALINGCVGAGNHGKYVAMLASAVIGLQPVSHELLRCFSFGGSTLGSVLRNALPAAALAVVVALQSISLGLVVWHMYLVLAGKTSLEVLRPDKCHWLRDAPQTPPAGASWMANLKDWLVSECLHPVPHLAPASLPSPKDSSKP
ncbi:putative protein S-acyltransferase 16 [Diplonema papillatum]|nr:putative protein S-acyltransferase 16 [Diplonema papillatum]